MLKIENLSKAFDKKTILDSFSYEFDPCGIYLIKGESGVGKTTLLRIIAGLDKDFTGSVSGGGIACSSYCFQEYRLFPSLSALENITEISYTKALDADIQRTKDMLKILGFSEEELSLKPKQLSGGMKQRVAFVRAVMKNSEILILDEPTKEVDAKIRDKMKQIISKEAERRLILMVTHNEDDTAGLNAKIINL